MDFILFDPGRALVERVLEEERFSRFHPLDPFDSYDLLAMADFIAFNAGRIIVEDTGWGTPVKFDLSTKAVAAFSATDGYAARAAITGTGYAQGSQSEPASTTATLGQKAFSQLSWATGSATDWQSPCSIVASDGSAALYCAWNLVAGGASRDMSQANTTLNVTPTYLPTNPP
jgi:hypothetical protein